MLDVFRAAEPPSHRQRKLLTSDDRSSATVRLSGQHDTACGIYGRRSRVRRLEWKTAGVGPDPSSLFGTQTLHFGIQSAPADIDPPSVLSWQIGVTDIDSVIERCRWAGISYEPELNNPAPGWTYRRLLIRTPGGYGFALEGPREYRRSSCLSFRVSSELIVRWHRATSLSSRRHRQDSVCLGPRR